jgi:hypothetical protein
MRSGYKVQKREAFFWHPRYRIVRTDPDTIAKWGGIEVGRFWTLRGANRWLTTGWWGDLDG